MTQSLNFIALIVLIGVAIVASAQAAVPVISEPQDSRIIIKNPDFDHDLTMLRVHR